MLMFPLMHGVLILVPPCILLIHHRDSLPSEAGKGERKLRVADRHETDADAVGTLPLLLSSGFILKWNNVLLVPIMRRKLFLFLCWMMVFIVTLGTMNVCLSLMMRLLVLP